MEIIEVTSEVFEKIIQLPYHIFGSGSFAELNKSKADKVYYLIFKDCKYRLGITCGIKNNSFYTPFSAPFGGFTFLSQDIKINFIDDALILLKGWAEDQQLKALHITLPPSIYNESFIAKQINALFRSDFTLSNIDLNYSFHLENFTELYDQFIWRNSRKNLRIAMQQQLDFRICNTLDEKEIAYEVIKKNRESRNFPLRMTWEQVSKTIELINADFFLVLNSAALPIASAVVFHVADDIVQVLYWGDLPEFANFKTMNYISFKVFEYYKSLGKKIVDIGPSTENSIPNYGLCEFKESIGCGISTKLSFKINLK